MKINYVLLGEKIRKTRKKKGISQMELAERIDRSATYLSNVENGIKCCSLETLVLIANELNVSTDDLLVDSLKSIVKVSNHRFATIIADCSDYETQILIDIVAATKQSMRNHRHLFQTRYK